MHARLIRQLYVRSQIGMLDPSPCVTFFVPILSVSLPVSSHPDMKRCKLGSFIDMQVNGAFSIDFSEVPSAEAFPTIEAQDKEYLRRIEYAAIRLVETGVTSFVATLIVSRVSVVGDHDRKEER